MTIAIFHPIAFAHALARESITKGISRSPHWPGVRARFLSDHGQCAACGGDKFLQVHHVVPFHDDPSLELDETNLITLCTWRLCHLRIGHGGDYKYFNPDVRQHAAVVRTNIEDAEFLTRMYARAESVRKPNQPGVHA